MLSRGYATAVGKVHRACAVRCLSGGVPPGLLVRDESGNAVTYLLVGEDGRALTIHPQRAALNAQVSGTLEVHDGVPIFKAQHLEISSNE